MTGVEFSTNSGAGEAADVTVAGFRFRPPALLRGLDVGSHSSSIGSPLKGSIGAGGLLGATGVGLKVRSLV